MSEYTNSQLTEIYNKANNLRPNQLAAITTERVFAAMRAMLDEPPPVAVAPRKLSARLVAMLRYAKTLEPDLTWHSVSKALGELYHPDMNLPDSLHHLVAAFEEVLREPRFEPGYSDGKVLELLLSPIKGCNSIEMLGPKTLEDSYSINQFYSAMAAHLWSRLRLTRVDWCRDQLDNG